MEFAIKDVTDMTYKAIRPLVQPQGPFLALYVPCIITFYAPRSYFPHYIIVISYDLGQMPFN